MFTFKLELKLEFKNASFAQYLQNCPCYAVTRDMNTTIALPHFE